MLQTYKPECNLFGICIYPFWLLCGWIFILGTKEFKRDDQEVYPSVPYTLKKRENWWRIFARR